MALLIIIIAITKVNNNRQWNILIAIIIGIGNESMAGFGEQPRETCVGLGSCCDRGDVKIRLSRKSKAEQTREEQLERQLNQLRKKINIGNPSFVEFKKVMAIGIREAKIEISAFKQKFKAKRKQFTKQLRETNMEEYLECLYGGLVEMDLIASRKLMEIGRKVGLKDTAFVRFENQVENSMKEILEGESEFSREKCLSVEQTKTAIKKRIEFIRQSGKQYMERAIAGTREWDGPKRASLQILLPLIIADAALQSTPQLNTDSIFQSQIQHQKELIAQSQQLQFALTPLMLLLNSAIHRATGKDLSEFNQPQPGEMRELNTLQNLQMDQYREMSHMIEESGRQIQ